MRHHKRFKPLGVPSIADGPLWIILGRFRAYLVIEDDSEAFFAGPDPRWTYLSPINLRHRPHAAHADAAVLPVFHRLPISQAAIRLLHAASIRQLREYVPR